MPLVGEAKNDHVGHGMLGVLDQTDVFQQLCVHGKIIRGHLVQSTDALTGLAGLDQDALK